MSSNNVIDLRVLLDKTEQNIKRIDIISGEFAVIVLNQWRYATRHILTFLQTHLQCPQGGGVAVKEEELRMATNHLKRAYFDSCDILIDCLLAKIRDYKDAYDYHIEIVKEYIPEYPEMRKRTQEAWRKHCDANGFTSEEREKNYDLYQNHVDDLWNFWLVLDDNAPVCDKIIRKKRRKEILVFIGFVVASILIPICAWIFTKK